MKAFLRVQGTFDDASAAMEAMAREPISDRPAFREIVERLGASVRSHFFAVLQDSPATQERKRWGSIRRDGSHGGTGNNPATMFSTGNSFANIEERSTDVSAAVKAGPKEDFWLSLHNKGKGWAYWSADNRTGYRKSTRGKKQKTTAQLKKEAAKAGAVTFPERPIFFIPAADEAFALERISLACEDSMMRKWDGDGSAG